MLKNVYLSIGSNMGSRITNINSALKLLKFKGVIKSTSFLYKTAPLYNLNQDYFLNAVLHYQTELPPFELLSYLQNIEKTLGRIKTTYKGPRIIDLDILLYESLIMDENSLEIPHPGIAERDFVLRPLLDINPQIIHPKTNLSIQNLYENFLKNSDFKTSYPKKIFAIPQDGKKEINLDFSLKTYTMGVFNITPNSFYNPLESNDISKILKKIKESVSNFDIFDIGGESTNPKSQPISYQEEISRVLPLIKAIKKDHSFDNIMISLDTRKSEVLKAVHDELPHSISIINDVSGGLFDPKLQELAGKNLLPYILMHTKGTPQNMDSFAIYNDVVKEIIEWFEVKTKKCIELGIPRWNIILDPGFGFAKNIQQNYEILKNLKEIKKMGFPILVGFSNKRFVKDHFGESLDIGNSCLAAISIENGADIIRIHDKDIAKSIAFANKIYKN